MSWDIEYTERFESWWQTLDEQEQASVAASVGLLERFGPALGFPHSSAVHGSRGLAHGKQSLTWRRSFAN